MAQAHHIPEVTTLATLKARILTSCQTALVETDERISQEEATEEALREISRNSSPALSSHRQK